jgi:putative DNA primase/helicase
VQIRVFGTQNSITVENRVSIFATGCNISVKADMVRRTLMCTIDADDERPEQRVFKRNPYAEILADRGKYIAAIMTISRAFLRAGEPSVDCLRLNSFGAWSRFVQKPLVWLGRADPVKSVDANAEADPERAALREVLVPWFETLGEEAVTMNFLSVTIDDLESDRENAPYANPSLRKAFMSIARDRKFGRDTLDTRRLGAWLKKHAGRIVDGLKLVKAGEDGHNHVVRWQVISRKKGASK